MSAHFVPILFAGIFIWSIYRRVRRNIGRQRLYPRRAIKSIVILLVVGGLFGSQSFQNLNLLLGFGGGILLGALLGFIGLRLTEFETTDQGHFYKPNTHIGVIISLVFVGRIIYRLWTSNGISIPQQNSPQLNHPQLFQNPLTLFIFGLTVGYYVIYQAGLFKHSRDKNLSASKNLEPAGSNLDSSRDRS